MANKKTTFNPQWVDEKVNPEWSTWLKEVDHDPFSASCTVCKKIFSLSNMGRQAITSHEKCSKHERNIKSRNKTSTIKQFFQCNAITGNNIEESKSSCNEQNIVKSNNDPMSIQQSSNQKNTLENFVSKEAVLRAETIWAMKLVTSHSSYNSFNDAATLFKIMFPDSNIAKSVTLSSSKMSYVVCFGLAPYFSDILRKDIANSKFVICFDEALNKISQKGQMDIVIRYWSESTNRVCTRYFNSVFLGHSTALDLVAKFREGTKNLDLGQLFQLSMDGPNVNLKMARMLSEDLSSEHSCEILDLGTCGLHVIHGALRTGHKATDWNLNSIFRAIYQLFKDSPARRADYIAITGSDKFPLKFCEVRWVENVGVAERAIEVFSFIKTYIQQSALPKTQTVVTLQEACSNKLILPQMAFYSSVASLLQPYLKKYQSNDPRVPFLYQDIHFIISQLMKRFVKSEVMRSADTAEKCMKIDISDKDNLCTPNTVDIGIAASGLLAKCHPTENEKRQFRIDCLTFLKTTTAKIFERSPLKYNLVRFVSCLNPKLIASNSYLSEKRMTKLLENLYSKKHLTSAEADKAKQQYNNLCYKAKTEHKDTFEQYSYEKQSLDMFYSSLIAEDKTFEDLWKVIKMVLILSNGNAPVESGFSINKDILIENLAENSLISIRTVYDAVKAAGGIEKVNLDKNMLNNVKMARLRYHQYLDEVKKVNNEANKKDMTKRKALEEIKLLKAKKAKLAKQAAFETTNIDGMIAELSKKIM